MKSLVILCLLFSSTLFGQVDYDSLLTVAQTSNNKADFKNIDSLIRAEKLEFNTEPNLSLIYTCVERTKELKFDYLYAHFIFRESIINTIQGHQANATKLAKEALKIFSKYNSVYAYACYNTIGGMVASQGDTESGIEYLNKAFQILAFFPEQENYWQMFADNHLVLGYIHILAEDYDSAEYHISASYDLALKSDYFITQTYCLLNFAKIYLEKSEFDLAKKNLDESLLISQEHDLKGIQAITYTRIAEVHFKRNELDSSLYYYQIAEKLATKEALEGRLLTIYKKTKQLYLKKNDVDAAFEYQEKYIELSEKLSKQEKEEEYQILQIRFGVNEKNTQIKSLALERNHELERNKLLVIAIIITITAFILLIGIIILTFNRYRLNRRIQNEIQEKELSMHQMTALKSQMNPHFTFNALNSIQDLILKEKPEESYRYISKFAELVRKTLNQSSEEFINVEEEFTALKLYTELESLRFDGDINITFETNGIEDLKIPPLLIQPFVENAIKHGLLHKKGEKKLAITFKLNENLTCIVTDNGIGREATNKIKMRRSNFHKSFATQSIADRFELLKKVYGKKLGFIYTDNEADGFPSGTTVVITLPIKREF